MTVQRAPLRPYASFPAVALYATWVNSQLSLNMFSKSSL